VGAGILGTAVALNLARMGVKVTALDCLAETKAGEATRASWAWLNANQKHPRSYKWLNQLGMTAWCSDKDVSHLPDCKGALVRVNDTLDADGGYSMQGPLTVNRLAELEPQASVSQGDGCVYFFPEEGCVDPIAASIAMRRAAERMGAKFIFGQNVTEVLRNAEGRTTGAVSRSTCSDKLTTTVADIVVVAAGVGSARLLWVVYLCWAKLVE